MQWNWTMSRLQPNKCTSVTERKSRGGRKKKNPSRFSPDDMEGASAIMRKDGENCCSRNSFLWEDNLQLGNRPFYVPPSPVIGCHWSCVRGKRLHGSFPDFPGDFSPPTALRVYGVQTDTPRSAFLKSYSTPNHLIASYLRHCASHSPGCREECFSLTPRLTSSCTQLHRLVAAW